MKKYLLLITLFIAGLSSCSKNQAETQAAIDDRKIQIYLSANHITMTKDPSGVYYEIIRPGTGPYPVNATTTTASSTLQCNYTGSYLDGQVFQPQPSQIVPTLLSSEIPGWWYAMPHINAGGRIMFIVPSALAYGPEGNSPIPPNAVVIFTVDLVGFY